MSKSRMDKAEMEAWSPVATIEDIHKRLTRPPQQSSSSPHLYELQHHNSSLSKSNLDTSPLQKWRKLTPSSSVIAPNLSELQHDHSSQSKLDTSPIQKRRKSRAVKVTNNERLEDYLDLSLLSTVREKMKKQTRKKKVKSEFPEFVWPVGDHDECKRRTDDEAIVDLKNHDDSFGEGEENHVNGVDPFQRFESTALIRFKNDQTKMQQQ